jgi:hypothetical protein
VRKRPTSDYIWLGTAIRFLLESKDDRLISGNGGVKENLDSVLEDLPALELRVASRLATSLGLPILAAEFADAPDGAALSADQSRRLGEAMGKVRDTVIAEALGNYAYVVSERRLPVAKLTDCVEDLFPAGVFDALPELSRYDFTEAGKCIAFERPTAASFHVLRGTEGALRDFYLASVKQKRVKSLMWGPMLEHLRKRSKPPPRPMLDHLDHIRENFRNPTQHPEARYDIDEAQDVFSLCVDACTRLVRALPNSNDS